LATCAGGGGDPAPSLIGSASLGTSLSTIIPHTLDIAVTVLLAK
jgi:hypothetical protein